MRSTTEGQAASPGRNKAAESQRGIETRETDECTDLHDTATSTITTSRSLCKTSCECQCCSNVSVLSPKDMQLGSSLKIADRIHVANHVFA